MNTEAFTIHEAVHPLVHSHITMYSDIPQVNQLTALLLAHGIKDVVVCPGSRNATIVHNLNEVGDRIQLHPVTDERSAAFVALGMTLATQAPVGVCVTSGSALLNCIPAVAEAYYRHLPLLVISADRPTAWIGQMDGQTLPQAGALHPYCPTFSISTPRSDTDRWCNNRRINEALLSLYKGDGHPAHINVAIEEPMFSFTTPALPEERGIRRFTPMPHDPLPESVVEQIAQAKLPLLLIGQYEKGDIRKEVDDLVRQGQMLVLPEIISDVEGNHLMEAFDAFGGLDKRVMPDVVVQVGGNFVHKRMKQALRGSDCKVIRIGLDEELTDTLCHLASWIDSPVQPALAQLATCLPHANAGVEFATEVLRQKWESIRPRLHPSTTGSSEAPTMTSILMKVKERLASLPQSFTLHLANSSTVRAAGKVFESGQCPVYCNRGTNGIEGSLSTAVGYALRMWGLSIAVIGDLSFFYDGNALWNTALPSNLRILLFNNGHGSIFDHLTGLEQSPARDTYIAAGHQHYNAEGLAHTFHLGYTAIHAEDEAEGSIAQWLADHDEAQILEVFVKD